jgi:hypothetical protein
MTIERQSYKGLGLKGKIKTVELNPDQSTNIWEYREWGDEKTLAGYTITALTTEAVKVEHWTTPTNTGEKIILRSRALIQQQINEANLKYGMSLRGYRHRIIWRP